MPRSSAGRRARLGLLLLFLRSTDGTVAAFAPSSGARIRPGPGGVAGVSSLASSAPWDGGGLEQSAVLADEDVHALIRFDKGGKEKVVNAFGVWSVVVSLITCPIWAAAMWAVSLMYKINGDWDPNRAVYDATGKIWAKAWLAGCMSYPTISGDVDRLKEGQGPCLFVANHASWLDIPVLCTVLDPVFKFISKAELKGVPCIGHQLVGGNHILIDRKDRRSQLRTFKDGIGWLKKGVPLMAFPEGKRSKDGRLMDFKGGMFVMAVKTKVPIVPISIANTHAVMPSNALFPVQAGGDMLRVHVHEPIDTEGLSEDEIAERVRTALLSQLPPDQHPLPEILPEESPPGVEAILGEVGKKIKAEKEAARTQEVSRAAL